MCLNHASEEELVRELSQRIDQGKVKFHFTYYYNDDTQQLQLINAENNRMMLNFNQTMGIEKAYLCRHVYKNHCKEKEQKIKAKKSQTEMDEYWSNFTKNN